VVVDTSGWQRQLAGVDVSSLTTQLLAWRNSSSAWGAFDHYSVSFPDTALALSAASAAGINAITASQNTDGGWPFTPVAPAVAESQSQVIATAYNILTLHQYKAYFNVEENMRRHVHATRGARAVTAGTGLCRRVF